jgi:hypothetical protein
LHKYLLLAKFKSLVRWKEAAAMDMDKNPCPRETHVHHNKQALSLSLSHTHTHTLSLSFSLSLSLSLSLYLQFLCKWGSVKSAAATVAGKKLAVKDSVLQAG